MVFFDEYDIKISFDKSVVPLKWFSSKPIISNFKFLIFIIVFSFIYFYNSYLDITKILLSLNSILSNDLEPSIWWILNLSKSLNLLNKSLVNYGDVSVGAGVIIKTFNLFLTFNYLMITPPIIKVFPLRHLQPHKKDLFPSSINSDVFYVINSWWNRKIKLSLLFK